jgi:hypothetical protein
MGQHLAEGIVTRPLAQASVQGNVAAEKALNARPDVSHDRARSHDDASHDPKALYGSVARDLESGGRQWMCLAHWDFKF